ncbi:MAG: tetratricopeptide repeat protein, partial [Gammaproteobacteria bacterium]
MLEAAGCTQLGQELRCRAAGGTVGIPLDQVERIDKSDPPRRPQPARPRQTDRPASPPPPLPVEPASPEGSLDPQAARARLEELSARRAPPGQDRAVVDREIALLHARLGHERVLAGDYEAAESHYLRALEHQPDLMLARLNLATLMINLSRYDEAERMLQD